MFVRRTRLAPTMQARVENIIGLPAMLPFDPYRDGTTSFYVAPSDPRRREFEQGPDAGILHRQPELAALLRAAAEYDVLRFAPGALDLDWPPFEAAAVHAARLRALRADVARLAPVAEARTAAETIANFEHLRELRAEVARLADGAPALVADCLAATRARSLAPAAPPAKSRRTRGH